MAQDPPPSVDVTDIQFKIHDKFTVFNAGDKLRSSVNLLAVASNYGLMFVGNPNEAELKVILIKDLVESKESGRGLHARQVQLPHLPNCIAVSSDGSMLAVNYTLNGCGFVIIYSVPSFTTANIKSLHNIRLPGDENISALQLLWNPVISGSLAVVMSNGALGMYDFKNNSYEFHTLDSKEQISCGSWSPKGKQIVLGFPNGKLAQYKPDLKLARTIVCPPNIHPGPFDTISIQWLSTFQFAVVFLQKCEDSTPALYIVHAPKVGTPTYTTHYDICYSNTGPRAQQVNLTHIPQWNLLLVTSANGVEIGILGTKETSEAPKWVQYTLLDEARIEMPLTEDKDETYPIGFALDTSSTHSLTIAEKKMPVMPMVHVLSTHGQLVSFNFLNLQPNTPDICSPPPPPSDTSGMSQFKPVSDMLTQRKSEITIPATSLSLSAGNQAPPIELSFPALGMTSTPALEKPKAIFGAPSTTGSSMFGAPVSGFSFNPQAAAPIATSAPSFFRNSGLQQTAQQPSTGIVDVKKQPEQQPLSTLAAQNNQEKSKPLYTVSSSFTPPSVVMPTPSGQSQPQQQQMKLPQINANEVDDIVNEMIVLQINSFDMELKKLASQSKGLLNNIGSTDEMKTYTKRLNDLQEIVEQADDKEFESDLQGLRNLLNETYAMVAECRSKLNMYNNPDIAKLKNTSSCNPINRRQLAKLQSYLANNQAQLQIINNQIDAQWSNFQDVMRRNSKTQMHTPCLEGIYQRMTRLKDMLARERTKLNYIKSKLKEKGLLNNQLRNTTKPEVTMESLTDTILSMSLGPSVEESRSKLTKEKLDAIRKRLENRKITIIKPQRPDRVGLNSEVILETKLKTDRKIRDGAATNMDKMEQERIRTEQQRVLTKPTATKAVASSMATISQPSMASISQPNAPATFGFGGMSPFVKPTSGKPEEFKKEQQHQQPAIVKPVASTAAPMFLKSAPSTTATPSPFGGYGAPPNASAGFPGLSITPTTMPVFSGFGANKPLTFGGPKPLVPNPPAKEVPNNDSKEQTAPIGFAPKPMTSETKPFAMSSFSSPFTAVAPSKPVTVDVGDKENKTPDTQSFMPVATKSEIIPVSSSAANLNFVPANIPGQGQSGGFSFGIGNAATLAKTTSATPSGPFTFSFSSALNSGTDTTTTVSKPIFAGLTKPAPTATTPPTPKSEASAEVAAIQAKSESVENTTDTTGFTFSSLNLGTLGLPATPNLSPTPSTSAVQPSNTLSVAPVKTTAASATDPTDSLFGGLNICKPLGAENGAFKPTFGGGNIFGSTSFVPADTTTDTKSIFGASAPPKEPAAFTGFGTTTIVAKPAPEAASVAATTTPNAAPITTTSTTSVFAPKVTQTFSFGLPTSTTGTGSIATGQAAQTTTVPTMFSALTAPSSFAATSTATTTVATSTTTGGSLFSGLTFGTPTSQPTSSIFGAAATSVSTTPTAAVSTAIPQYLNTSTSSMPVATPFGAPVATSAGSMFSSVAATTTPAVSTASGNIFGGIPKPDQSVFGQPDGNVFGTPTADPAASGGSLFGGQASAFGTQPTPNAGGSIFGGSASATNAFGSNPGANIFANANASAAPNVFGAAAQPTGASGGSIFDQSAASGQSGGSLFGGAGTGFGAQSSPFGAAPASGGSIFGGSATTSPKPSSFGAPAPSAFGSANSGGFGLFSQTPAFGSPTQVGANAGGGSFAQGGSSIAQTGFASPTGATAFTKPVFGAAPSFGGAPTFGSPPSFGAAASFGSPKAFGSFAAPNASVGAFTSPTQKNNLFEALGSSDTGLSFGNLAQNTNANQQKPAFGGSSFMSYRS